MGNSASGMLTVKQPDKVAQPRDKKIDKIIGDIINQTKYIKFTSVLLVNTKTQPV